MRGVRTLALAALLITLPLSAAHTQASSGVSMVSIQPLSFGQLIPGVPERIAVTDVARRAMIALTGSGTVDVTLLLPAALTTATGAEIPIQFGTLDAALLASPGAAPAALNVRQVNRVQVTPDHPVYIVVGGTAVASIIQRPGDYSAIVSLVVSQPGT